MSSIVLLFALATSISNAPKAQVRTESAKPNTFSTKAECEVALKTGQLRFYEPSHFGLAGKDPVNGHDTIVVALETDLCLEMLIVGGRRFVAQREGTKFRARILADGSPSLYARNDCGNPVYGVIFPPPPAPEPPAPRLTIAVPVEVPEEPKLRPLREPATPKKKKGFCKSKACRIGVVIGIAAAGGGAAWYYSTCPPGTTSRRR